MGLALFDLDNTLLDGDSDYLWGRFLVERGIVDGDYYEAENQRFYDEYTAGTLDIRVFLRFVLQPLAAHPMESLLKWREEFIAEKIEPIILPAGRNLLSRHQAQEDTCVIITATNRFITGPIAEKLGVEHLLATEPETRQGNFTGEVVGTPCFQEGKVERLSQWLLKQGQTLEESWFYSDSHNDLPLLEKVTHAIAVDPDPVLTRHARLQGWPVISLRA